jgi:hypothetical protein
MIRSPTLEEWASSTRCTLDRHRRAKSPHRAKSVLKNAIASNSAPRREIEAKALGLLRQQSARASTTRPLG